MAIFHYIKQKLQTKLDKNKNNNSKYNKRVNEDLIAWLLSQDVHVEYH